MAFLKLQLLIAVCFFNIHATKYVESDYKIVKRLLKNTKKDYSSLKILFASIAPTGDFTPPYKLAVQLKNRGVKIDYLINEYYGYFNWKDTEKKLHEIDADVIKMNPYESFTKKQLQNFKYAVAENYLYSQNRSIDELAVKTFANTHLTSTETLMHYSRVKSRTMLGSILLHPAQPFYNHANFVMNKFELKKYDLIISDIHDERMADVAYRQKIPYVKCFQQMYPMVNLDSVNNVFQPTMLESQSKEFSDNDLENLSIKLVNKPHQIKHDLGLSSDNIMRELTENKLNYLLKFYNDLLFEAKNSVYSTLENFDCNFTYGARGDSNLPCKYFTKSIIFSTRKYWRNALEHSVLKDHTDMAMKNLDGMQFLGNRNIVNTRDPSTDPESWAPNKQNPFDSQHLPRVYLSLGTAVNNNLKQFYAIMKILNDRKYPSEVAAGGNTDLYQQLEKFKKDNSLDNIKVWNFAPQTEILARSDVYFCHGGASSTNEGIFLEVPMLMVPQAFDQFGNANLLTKAKIAETINDTDNLEKEITTKLDKQLNNWKSYRDELKPWSEDMKKAESYESAADKLLKDLTEGDELIIKDKLPINETIGASIYIYQ